MILSLDAAEREKDLYFASFADAKLQVAEVIVGCNSEISKGQVLHALGDISKGVDIFKARPGFGEFEIVRNKNKRLWP